MTTEASRSTSIEGLKSLFRKEMLNEMAALSMLLIVAFLILSIVSYDPADVAGATWPLNPKPNNLGGRFGAVTVDLGYSFLGVSTYLLVAVLGIYGTLIFFRRRAADWPVRMLGAFMLVISFSALFGNSYSESGIMPSRGGIIGNAAFGVLNENFGLTGTYLVLGFMAFLSFLLATDVLFYPLIRDLLHPLGDENEISGPLEIPVIISEPLNIEEEPESDGKAGKSFLQRVLGIGKAEDDDDDDQEVTFEPDLILIPRDLDDVEETKQKTRGRRSKAVLPPPAPEQPATEAADWAEGMNSYKLPEVSLLTAGKKKDTVGTRAELQRNAEIISQTYSAFKINVNVAGYTRGPTVTTYEMEIPPDVMINKITRYKDNLALNLRVSKVRMVTSAGKSTIGVEVPNQIRDMVTFREILETEEFEKASAKMDLPMAFGKDAIGNPVIRDLAKMPHLLVGGATGQGKSVFENVMLASLLMSRTPYEMRLIMIDPKQVEFTPYADTPHLLAPVIDDSRKAVGVFEWLIEEMENRYTLLKNAGVRKISEYNELKEKTRVEKLTAAGMDPDEEPNHLPFIVCIVDELADLIMVNSDTKVDAMLARIAAKARAAGIHLILVTQSPRADVLTGLIKSNIPARVSLRVNTGTESRIVLGTVGAEDLLGMGDLLMVMPGEQKAIRAQSAFIDDPELNRVLDTLRGQLKPNYCLDPDALSGPVSSGGGKASKGDPGQLDPDFEEAVDQIMAAGRASGSFLRTAMSLGHTRATRIIIQMERAGIVGPARGAKEREIMITFEEWEARKASGDLAGKMQMAA